MTNEGGGRTAVEEQAVHRRLMRFGEHESLATPMWEERNTSVESIASATGRLLREPELRADLAARALTRSERFTWAGCAGATLRCYEAVAAQDR